jgi:hypothetical protein
MAVKTVKPQKQSKDTGKVVTFVWIQAQTRMEEIVSGKLPRVTTPEGDSFIDISASSVRVPPTWSFDLEKYDKDGYMIGHVTDPADIRVRPEERRPYRVRLSFENPVIRLVDNERYAEVIEALRNHPKCENSKHPFADPTPSLREEGVSTKVAAAKVSKVAITASSNIIAFFKAQSASPAPTNMSSPEDVAEVLSLPYDGNNEELEAIMLDMVSRGTVDLEYFTGDSSIFVQENVDLYKKLHDFIENGYVVLKGDSYYRVGQGGREILLGKTFIEASRKIK